jgi:hypothetical protein
MRKAMVLMFCFLFLPAALLAQSQAQADNPYYLFSDVIATRVVAMEATDFPDTVVRHRYVNIDFALLDEKEPGVNDLIDLNLFDDVYLLGIIDQKIEYSSDSYALVGTLEGEKTSSVILSINKGVAAGAIRTSGDQAYQITMSKSQIQQVTQIDASKFPPCGVEQEHGLPLSSATYPETNEANIAENIEADDGSIIDVLVVYTQAARIGAGGTAAIEATINAAILETNTAYLNSIIIPRIFLVHTQEVSYDESTGTEQAMFDLRNNGIVRTLRDAYCADLVAMLIDKPDNDNFCGFGFILPNLMQGNSEFFAFSVTDYQCAAAGGNFTFAHELAHNMGCAHASGDVDDDGLFSYSKGHRFFVNLAETTYRTIMAYAPGTQINYFSNPNVSFIFTPTGISNAADNARTINNSASTVANWRITGSSQCGLKPDLVVTSIAYNPASPNVGEPVILTVTIENQGLADAGPFNSRWYADRATPPSNSSVSNEEFEYFSGGLAVGATTTHVDTYTYTTDGPHNSYAQVDIPSAILESDENNLFGPIIINVTEVDLKINSIVLSPASPKVGEPVTVTVTIENQGTSDSGQFFCDWYADRATPPVPGDFGDKSQEFGSGLAAGATTTLVATYTYTTGGPHAMYAQVDSDEIVTESDENNNLFGPQNVNVIDVDLKINSILFSPMSPEAGQPVTVTVTIENQGLTDSDPFFCDWYANRATPPVPGDFGDKSQEFGSGLAAGATATHVDTYTYTYATAGEFSTFAQVDSDQIVDETNETNNVFGATPICVWEGELLDYNIIEDSSTSSIWLGGDDRAVGGPGNMGVGQSMIFARNARVDSAGFNLTDKFDYYESPEGIGHAVTLVMQARELDGTIIHTASTALPASFDGGWVMIPLGPGIWFKAGVEYVFTCYVQDGDSNHLSSSARTRDDDPWPLLGGYTGGGSPPVDMTDWANWTATAKDYNFQMIGQYVETYPGDFNEDFSVDLLDVLEVGLYWLANDCLMPEWCEMTDMNWDREVQNNDFSTLARFWGSRWHLYDDLDAAEIESLESLMSTATIDGSDGNELNPGSYAIYKTDAGRYGKFIVEDFNAATHALTIAWVTYNADGTVYSSGSGLVIRGTWSCDLDLGLETSVANDFQWTQATGVTRYITPNSGAIFNLMHQQ